jgi:L-methionine (R)-S-oxide reductase
MEKNREIYSEFLNDIGIIVDASGAANEKMQKICDYIKGHLTGYDWVGFYLVDKEKPRELVLGPYSGEPTEHIRIPFGKGICGQAAEIEKVFIIDDVAGESNYLSCSLNVKSEIVLPIFKNGIIIGELDIDSHQKAAFGEIDRIFLENVCKLMSELF